MVVNGPGHSHAATHSTATGRAVSHAIFNGVYGNAYYGSDATSSFALNAQTGALLWRYRVGGYVTSSVLDQVHHIVYVGSTRNTAYALNSSTGSLLWHYQAGSVVSQWPAPIMNSILYLFTNTDIYALNATHGGVLWRFTTAPNTSIEVPWSLVNGAVYFMTSDGIVHALAGSNGVTLWQQQLAYSGSVSSVVNGVVYVISASQYPIVDSTLYALNASNGSFLWHYTLVGTREGGGGPVFIIDHRLFVISDFNHGVFGLTLLDPATGSLIWPHPPITGAYSDTGSMEPLTILHGVMYFNTYWAVYAVRVSDGKTLWSYQPQDDVAKMIVYHNVVYLHHGIFESGPITAHSATDGSLLWSYQPQNPSSMLAIVNGAIYLDSSNLYTVNASNGKLLWNVAAAESYLNIINGVVYCKDTNTSALFALNAATGATLWSHSMTPSQDYWVQEVIKGILYVQSNDSIIYAFDNSTGKLLWKYPSS
jgi:outer membrane protein assembly factor BamB